MCVVAFAWDAHPRWRLIVAANRDEYHARPAAPLHAWGDGSGIIAGRDLQSGGTWLGVTASGRCALVTNYRLPGHPAHELSRGTLVTALLGDTDPMRISIAGYSTFNLFCAEAGGAHVLTDQPETRLAVSPGVHGLSNGAYDEPWPKTVQLCSAVDDWLGGPAQDVSALFPALADATPPPGKNEVSPVADARLSPVFVRNPEYGTRCSTVLAIDRDGHGSISERSFAADARPSGDVTLNFRWP